MKVKRARLKSFVAVGVICFGVTAGFALRNNFAKNNDENAKASVANVGSIYADLDEIRSGNYGEKALEISLVGTRYKFDMSPQNQAAIKSLFSISSGTGIRSSVGYKYFTFDNSRSVIITEKKVYIDINHLKSQLSDINHLCSGNTACGPTEPAIFEHNLTGDLSKIKIIDDSSNPGFNSGDISVSVSRVNLNERKTVQLTVKGLDDVMPNQVSLNGTENAIIQSYVTDNGEVKPEEFFDKELIKREGLKLEWYGIPIEKQYLGYHQGVVRVSRVGDGGTFYRDYTVSARIERAVDTTAPVFSETFPHPIISRKGRAISIDDLRVEDPETTVVQFSNNSRVINLNPVNPVAGNYNLVYTAKNGEGLISTLERQVEITDADNLQSRIEESKKLLAKNKKPGVFHDTFKSIVDEAQKIVDNNESSQAEIDQAANNLTEGLIYKRFVGFIKFQELIESLEKESQAVRQDPSVISALNIANMFVEQQSRNSSHDGGGGDSMAGSWYDDLSNAIISAKERIRAQEEAAERERQAEQNRQDQARQAVEKAAQTLLPADIQSAKDKVSAVKTENIKNELNAKIQQVEALLNKRNELQAEISRAESTSTIGMTPQSSEALVNAIKEAKVKLSDKTIPQDQIQSQIDSVKSAISGLKVDKSALQASIQNTDSQPQNIKNAISAQLQSAKNTNADNNATVQQVADAKSVLDQALQNAIRAEEERQAEQNRQEQARQALEAAKKSVTPSEITRAQNLIDAVKDSSIKKILQDDLDAVKRQLETAKDNLSKILEQSRQLNVDGMTPQSINNLKSSVESAAQVLASADSSKSEIERATGNVVNATNGLRADKTALKASIGNAESQPDQIKNSVKQALDAAKSIDSNPNPTVKQVSDAKNNLDNALRSSIAEAEEKARQQKAKEAVDAATSGDLAKINQAQEAISQVNNPEAKAKLQSELNSVKSRRDEAVKSLREAIARAKATSVDGMTQESSGNLKQAISSAENIVGSVSDIRTIEESKNSIESAVNNLRADKTQLKEAIRNAENQPEYVKSEIDSDLNNAKSVEQSTNPSVSEVSVAKNKLEEAVRNSLQSESDRQQKAKQALQRIEASDQPTDTDPAQNLINAVRDPKVKQELQSALDERKAFFEKYNKTREELGKLIEKAKNTSTEGKTSASVNALKEALEDAELDYIDRSSTIYAFEISIQNLNNALSGLKTDKTDLIDAIVKFDSQPEYVKNSDEVKKALQDAKAISSQDNPSVEDVEEKTRALIDAINKQIRSENSRQEDAKKLIEDAKTEIENNLKHKDELPAVDVEKLKNAIEAVQDSNKKSELEEQLKQIEKAIEDKRLKIEEDKRVQAENKLQEELKRRREEDARRLAEGAEKKNAEKQLSIPNTGHQRQDDGFDFVPILAIIGGIGISGTIFAKSKFRKVKF